MKNFLTISFTLALLTAANLVNAQTGSSSVVNRYTFTDAAGSGTISYRLTMVDIDGAYESSPIRFVKAAGAAAHDMTVYSNPATDYVVITSTNAAQAGVMIQLRAMNGAVLKQVTGNTAKINLAVSELHPGNYIVRVAAANGKARTFKLLIAH